MYKKIFTAISLAFGIGMAVVGCGTDAKQPTPLAHHAKNPEQLDFDPSSVNWETDNGEGLKLHLEDTYLYMQFDHTKAGSAIHNIQFIIDIDNNTSTGNALENGADYIVENGYLYQSLDRDKWDWYEIGKVESAVSGLVDTVRVKLKKFENMQRTFGVSAQALDQNWKPVYYSPSAVDEMGNHLKTIYRP